MDYRLIFGFYRDRGIRKWDTGAAHAVLSAAGGRVETLEGKALVYGKEDVLNPFFVASASGYR
jgi:3'(2'), 5'-bisphosphate nucleotidase